MAAVIGEDEEVDKTLPAAKKKKATKKLGSPPDVVAMAKADTLDVCTVSVLKVYLKSVGLKVSGRKSELIERVKDHFSQPSGGDKTEVGE